MLYFTSPEFLRVLLLIFAVGLHNYWRQLTAAIVPEPYLDEVFHVPQAQAYWDGKWSQWDPKITTPPGLYLFSYAVSSVRSWFSSEMFEQSTSELRFTNFILLYLLLVMLYVWTAVTKRTVHHEAVVQREFSIVVFPLLFFFSGLYYTDLFSVFTVVLTFVSWSAASQAKGPAKVAYQTLHLVSGLFALGTRQTNVFWVAVYLGGLQVVDSVKKKAGLNKIHDPPVSECFFEDFLIMSISIAQHAITILPTLLLDLWPSLALFASFAVFVLFNGAVVLGDKSNHISTLHLPQLLYFFAFTIFFSWPTLLPLLSSPKTLLSRLPRRATFAFFAILAGLAIHFNTIIHPFLLADNRHYTFYTVRLLLLHQPLTSYLAIPIYLLCGFLIIAALGGTSRPRRGSVVAISKGRAASPDAVHVSWVFVWLLSTALSLVTAPLIEPRYFIIPWLVWRLHIPEVLPGTAGRNSTTTRTPQIQPTGQGMLSSFPSANHTHNRDAKSSPQQPSATSVSPITSSRSSILLLLQTSLAQMARFAPHIEFLWYTAINVVTCYVFLYRPFTWKQEPGVEMRFMW